MTECRCPACLEHEDELSAAGLALPAWPDEAPPPSLKARVLARAVSTMPHTPVPAHAPDALSLFAVVPAMAALAGAVRLLAAWIPAWRYWPHPAVPVVLEVLGPTGLAAVMMLGAGALATLAAAPALFLESQGRMRRRERTLGLHG
jgi:hypothetical protein